MRLLAGMGGDRERDLGGSQAVAVRGAALQQRQRLEGLDRRARESRALDIAEREHDGPVRIDDDSRAAMTRFDGVATGHFGENGIVHGSLRQNGPRLVAFVSRPVKGPDAQ